MGLFDKFLRPYVLAFGQWYVLGQDSAGKTDKPVSDSKVDQDKTKKPTTSAQSTEEKSTLVGDTRKVGPYDKGASSVPHSPLEDPRVTWIHSLAKDELIEAMKKFNLNTESLGMEELRRRFKDFWRSPLAAELGRVTEGEHIETSVTRVTDEMSSIREMLQLPPDADSKTVKRALSYHLDAQRRTDRPTVHLDLPDVRQQAFGCHTNPYPRTTGHNRPTTTEPEYARPPIGTKQTEHDASSICNIVRKWNLRFDGRKDPISFLERLDELTECYSMNQDDILKALPELLTGPALLWYRNTRDRWYSYRDFRSYFEIQFLPLGYRRTLNEEIKRRTQGDNEPFRDFATSLLTLIRRRGPCSEQEQLDLLFSNMQPDYKIMVRRSEFQTINHMCTLAESYESYLRDRNHFRPPPPPSHSMIPETAYSSKRKSDRSTDNAGVDDWKTQPVNTNRSPPETHHFRRGKLGEKPTSYFPTYTPTHTNAQPQHAPQFSSVNRSPAPTNMRQYPTSYPPKDRRNTETKLPRPTNFQVAPMQNKNDVNKRETCCWNCDEAGHFFRDCRKPKRLRCYNCKKDGIATKHCKCQSGNLDGMQH